MSDSKIPESLIKRAWHTYPTTGNMPASLNAPWFEHKSWRPLVKMLPHSPRCRAPHLACRARRIDRQRRDHAGGWTKN